MTARLLVVLLTYAGFHVLADGTSVTFRNDVMAVLAKGGCSSGPCHGNASGKAGFNSRSK